MANIQAIFRAPRDGFSTARAIMLHTYIFLPDNWMTGVIKWPEARLGR